MKIIITLLMPLVVFASSETLSPSEHNSIHGYNNRPVVKMNKKLNMHKLHKIDEEQARKIVEDDTNEEVISLKLTHSGRYIIYKARTKNYFLVINALDGTIENKEIK
ncbi:hypothetical protein N9A28_02530 [Sulfurimonas sp.]|nr:hypothetical protein [Sulfurimonas sp.]